ncbi:MAG TPA: energy transducer TonB [Rhodothermales bacterium]|nr:energy transducer TonB [Rhodothermales bacterium]
MRLAALLLVLAALAVPAAAQEAGEDSVYTVVERMPELIGGLAAIRPVYPEAERRAGVEGRVFVQFIVNEDGSVSDIVVTRGVNPGLDSAAVAAIRPIRFTPGSHRGQPVKVRFSIPINFYLTDDALYTRSDLSLRATRDANGAVLLRIPRGTGVRPQCADDGWCRITYREQTGYVLEAGLSRRPPPPLR